MYANKNMMRIYIMAAIAAVAFLAISLLLPFERNSVFWFSLLMGLVAAGVQVPVMRSAFDKGEGAKSKFYGWPIARVGVVYLAAQLVVSLICMALSAHIKARYVAVIDILLLAAAAIGFIATDATRDEIERQDVQLRKNVTVMRSLQSKVNAMAGRCEGEAGKALAKFADEMRYSDPVSSDALQEIETELERTIDSLQQAVVDNDTEAVQTLCRSASATLAERNRLCKLNK